MEYSVRNVNLHPVVDVLVTGDVMVFLLLALCRIALTNLILLYQTIIHRTLVIIHLYTVAYTFTATM
jgi:hypothetical protein